MLLHNLVTRLHFASVLLDHVQLLLQDVELLIEIFLVQCGQGLLTMRAIFVDAVCNLRIGNVLFGAVVGQKMLVGLDVLVHLLDVHYVVALLQP